jgi:hypothetical protein
MTYALIVVFTLTGQSYTERNNLTLNQCAGHAAMARQQLLNVQERLEALVGEVRYLCIEERS